jgi:hypothetical protein
MINDESVRAVAAAHFPPQFVRPLYDSYCFSQIPQLVRHLLLGDPDPGLPPTVLASLPPAYEKVVLFFVDAFGWRFYERHAGSDPFLQRIAAEGVVSKLTSQFPSTTAAHVTAIHTGLPVGESGVYEWFYYEPLVDALIAPLLFSFAGDRRRETLRQTGIPPADFFPRTTLHQELRAGGVRSVIFQSREYTPSSYSDAVFAGAEVVPYRTLPEALARLAGRLLTDAGKGYYFLYFDRIDTIGHVYGPDSAMFRAETDAFLAVMERVFHGALAGALHDTLFLLTADHGQVSGDPSDTIYLNHLLPALAADLQTNRAGVPLVPAGSARDMFLHVNEDRLDAVQRLLQTHLAGRAEIYRVDDLIAQGFFGPRPPAPIFRARVGNLLIAPYRDTTIWWHEVGRFAQEYRGLHGGLTPEEMETILLAFPYA